MRKLISLLILSAVPFVCLAQDYLSAPLGEWQQLFNDKDLDGWEIKIRGYDLDENLSTRRMPPSIARSPPEKCFQSFHQDHIHVF